MAYHTSNVEVKLFFDYRERGTVEPICDVLRTVYSLKNIIYVGDFTFVMGNLDWLLKPKTYLPQRSLLFLSKKTATKFLRFYIHEILPRNLQENIIMCITGDSLEDISSLQTSDKYHLIDAREGTSANVVASLILQAFNPNDPVPILGELVGNIKLGTDLRELVKLDKVLGPIFKILQAIETDQEIESGENVQKHHGVESPLLKVCDPEDIISETPLWKGRMKMLLVLTDQVELTSHLEKIEKLIASQKGEPLPPTSANLENTEYGDWDCVVKEEDKLGMYYLLKVKKFPTKQQLAEACEKFGRKSQFIPKICDVIGCNINTSSKYIVWPAYRSENQNNIIFVTDCPDFKQISDLEIKYWNEKMVDSENRDVIRKTVEDEKFIADHEMTKMKDQINQINSSKVIEKQKHRNITIITASPFRSKGYKKGNHEMIVENCIVLLVPLKGLIPIQEDPIPKIIGGFKTDVREGSFQWYIGGNPSEQHEHLKMGCAIGPLLSPGYGTLGGFVDHPVHGLCALTCAHVLLTIDELLSDETHIGRLAVQPGNSSAVFGRLVNSIFEEYGINQTGIDAALIKLERRLPDDGNFPDIGKMELRETGFKDETNLKYTSGNVCANLTDHRYCQLVKYGATTTLTRGVFAFNGTSLVYQDIVIRNQIMVYDIQTPFAGPGDSGSLVFIVFNNELVAAGLLIGGGGGYSLMTPICDVLQAVGCRVPPMMKPFPETMFGRLKAGIWMLIERIWNFNFNSRQ